MIEWTDHKRSVIWGQLGVNWGCWGGGPEHRGQGGQKWGDEIDVIPVLVDMEDMDAKYVIYTRNRRVSH